MTDYTNERKIISQKTTFLEQKEGQTSVDYTELFSFDKNKIDVLDKFEIEIVEVTALDDTIAVSQNEFSFETSSLNVNATLSNVTSLLGKKLTLPKGNKPFVIKIKTTCIDTGAWNDNYYDTFTFYFNLKTARDKLKKTYEGELSEQKTQSLQDKTRALQDQESNLISKHKQDLETHQKTWGEEKESLNSRNRQLANEKSQMAKNYKSQLAEEQKKTENAQLLAGEYLNLFEANFIKNMVRFSSLEFKNQEGNADRKIWQGYIGLYQSVTQYAKTQPKELKLHKKFFAMVDKVLTSSEEFNPFKRNYPSSLDRSQETFSFIHPKKLNSEIRKIKRNSRYKKQLVEKYGHDSMYHLAQTEQDKIEHLAYQSLSSQEENRYSNDIVDHNQKITYENGKFNFPSKTSHVIFFDATTTVFSTFVASNASDIFDNGIQGFLKSHSYTADLTPHWVWKKNGGEPVKLDSEMLHLTDLNTFVNQVSMKGYELKIKELQFDIPNKFGVIAIRDLGDRYSLSKPCVFTKFASEIRNK